MQLDLSSLEKTLGSLERVLARSQDAPADEDLRDACIKRFEYTYEISVKMLKRQLAAELPTREEVDSLPFKEMMRTGALRGLVRDPEKWFHFRALRNVTSHTYDEDRAAEVYSGLGDFAREARTLLDRLGERNA